VQSREPEPSFEGALEKLEGLVNRMEGGDIPLAELVEQFEEGNRLLTSCSKRLHDAELRIEMLRREREGIAISNFDPDKT
jgi:exodeoxyribonuclease VII small subunit